MIFSQNGNGRLTLKQQMLMKGILYDFSRHNARNAQHAQFVTNILDAVPRDVAEAQGFATQRVAFAEAVDNELRYFHSEKPIWTRPRLLQPTRNAIGRSTSTNRSSWPMPPISPTPV